MKLLLVLTSAIAVFTADYRDNPDKLESEPDYQPGYQNEHFPDNLVGSNAIEEFKNINDEHGFRSFAEEAEIFPFAGRDSTNEDQESIEGPASAILESFDAEEKHIKEINGRKEIELRGKKPDDILKELSKSLETFKYIMTHAYSELKVELETIREHQTNITNIGTELKEEQHYIRDNQSNLTDIVTDFKVKLDSINSMNLNLNNKTSLIISKLDYIEAILKCPSDFFQPNSSKRCYKMFTDTLRNWASADAKCRAEGLMLAEPIDPVTVGLYFMNKYSLTSFTWVGGKGDGSYIRWQRGGGEVARGNPLWHRGSGPGSAVTTSYCLTILTTTNYLKAPWSSVYYSDSCTNTRYTMCELVNSG